MSTTAGGERLNSHPQPSLLDLPIEIIHELFMYLVEEDHLLTVAQVSRHLNSIVTSFYFPGRSENPHHLDSITLQFYDFYTTSSSPCISQILVNTKRTDSIATMMLRNASHFPPTASGDILSFLSIAFDIHTITKLEWEFAGLIKLWPEPDLSQRLLKQQRHLILLLGRLQGITKISLNFTNRREIVAHPRTGTKLLNEWTNMVVELLNLSLGKLVVDENGVDEVDQAFQLLGGKGYSLELELSGPCVFVTPNKIIRHFQDTRYPTLRGPGREVLREWIPSNENGGEDHLEDGNDIRNIVLSPAARSFSKSITTWTISSSILFYPPLSEWTYQFLSTTPLISLSLTSIKYSYKWWSVILSWLSTPIPQLQQFTLRNCESAIPPKALAKFITNLPKLKECYIDSGCFVVLSRDFTTSNLPSTLKRFTAPSEFIWFTRPKGFKVLSRRVLGVKSKWEMLGVVLNLMTATRAKKINVDEVLKMYEDVPWVMLDLKGTKPKVLDTSWWPPCLWRLKNGKNQSQNQNYEEGIEEKREVPRYYGTVKEMVLSMEMMGYFMTETGFKKRLVDLIGIFKGLKVLRVVGRSGQLDAASIIANPTGNHRWVQPQWLDSLKAACGSLELVELELEGRTGKVVLRDFR